MTAGLGKDQLKRPSSEYHPERVQAETLESDVDCRSLAEAGGRLGGSGVPRFPMVVGGSGMTGSNMLVLLANTPGCEKIRVLDRVPIRKTVLNDSVELQKKYEFVGHRLGLDSREDLKRACEGIDCVFSIVTPDVQRGTKEDFHQTNVVGIQCLLEAASAAGVPRFVFLSSIAVTNHFEDSFNITEAETCALETLTSPYDISKRKGEDLVLAANGKHGMVTCALRAGGILLSPSDYLFRNFFIIPGLLMSISLQSKVDFIAAVDVVRGMVLAAKALENRPADTCAETFFLTKGESCGSGPLIAATAECLGWPLVTLPDFVFELGCFFQWLINEIMLRLGFSTPGIPPHMFWKMARIHQTFDNSKAQNVLGYTAEITVMDAVRHINACHLRNLENRGIRPMQWLAHLAFLFSPMFWSFVLALGILRVVF